MGCMFHLSEILSIIQCCNFYSPTARESLKISKQACFERYLEMLCQNTSRDGFLAVPLAKQVVNRARPHLLEWLTWRIKGWTRGTVMHQLPCDVKCADGLQRWLSGKPIKQRSHFWSLSGELKVRTFTWVKLTAFWCIISPLSHWIWKQLHTECSFD